VNAHGIIYGRCWSRLKRGRQAGTERKTRSSGPRPVQHRARVPSITTAGTLLTPCSFALEVTSALCMSWITTSCEEPAIFFTSSMASLHAEQPALKTSIFFLVFVGPPDIPRI
jgi:hypothetical protein